MRHALLGCLAVASGCTYDYLAAIGEPGGGGAATASSSVATSSSTGGSGGAAPTCAPCVSGAWLRDDETCHCYVFQSNPVDHDHADCNPPAKLVTITSGDEYALLQAYLDPKLAYGDRAWIGLKRRSWYTSHGMNPPGDCGTACDFCWANGDACPGYEHWAPDQPDNAGDCVVTGGEGNWHVKTCGEVMEGYICEYDAGFLP